MVPGRDHFLRALLIVAVMFMVPTVAWTQGSDLPADDLRAEIVVPDVAPPLGLGLQTDLEPPVEPAPPPEKGEDVAAIAQAYDDLFSVQGKNRFTGAAVVVVKDGAIAYAKGYGLEDVAAQEPIDPLQTQFRLASVSKTVVGSLLGIALDEGAVASIDDPITDYYSGFLVPDNGGVPLTLRMLATHQAGFAERRQPFLREGTTFPALNGRYAASQRPPFIEPAGQRSNYSNYGASLLALTVAEAMGGDFFELADASIFSPLGMTHTSFPLTATPVKRTADIEVFYPDGSRVPVPDVWYQNPMNAPAGGLIASGQDMARYLIGLMGGSEAESIPPLHSPATRDLIFSRWSATHPQLQGFGALFMVMDWNGERVVEHGGRTLGSTSIIQLFPERDLGVFVSVTGEGGSFLPLTSLLRKSWPRASGPSVDIGRAPGLLDLRATAPQAVLGIKSGPPETGGSLIPLDRFEGRYINQRRSVRAVDGIIRGLFLGDGTLAVARSTEDTLRIGWADGYVQVAPGVFYRDPSPSGFPSGWFDVFAFSMDEKGRVLGGSWYYTDGFYKPVSGLEDPAVQRTLLMISLITLLTGFFGLAWPRTVKGRWLAACLPACAVGLPLVYFAAWPDAPVEPLSYVLLAPCHLIPLQLLGDMLALIGVGLAVLTFRDETVLGAAFGERMSRIHRLILVLAALLFALAGWQAGLVGWNITV